MAEIVQEPVASGQIGGAWETTMYMIGTYWWVLLLLGIIIALIVIAFYIWRIKEENDRRRDSAVYATAMNLFESCQLNAKEEWIRNYWSFWNLLWLGIPFIRKEHSVRIVDIDRNVFGWYRGHCKSQDGAMIFLVYKTKSLLGLMEDKFLIYCPMQLKVPKFGINEKGIRVPRLDKKGNQELEIKPLPDDIVRYDSISEEWIVQANTMVKQGNYYRFPSYVLINPSTNKREHIDMTFELSNLIAKTNFIVFAEQTFGDMSRALGKGIEINPYLRVEQKTPEKEKQIENQSGGSQSSG